MYHCVFTYYCSKHVGSWRLIRPLASMAMGPVLLCLDIVRNEQFFVFLSGKNLRNREELLHCGRERGLGA